MASARQRGKFPFPRSGRPRPSEGHAQALLELQRRHLLAGRVDAVRAASVYCAVFDVPEAGAP